LAKRLYFHACCFVLFFVAASVSFHGFYAKSHLRENGVVGSYPKANFEEIMNGTAFRPFVFRRMLPDIARFVDRVVPEDAKTRFYNFQGIAPNTYLHEIAESPTARNPLYFFRYVALYAITFVFALIDLYAMYGVCRALNMPEPVAVFSSVLLEILLPYLMSGGGYFYDYGEIAFCALAVLFALRFDWWWLIPLAALGTWNKESFLLFILTLYPFFRLRRSKLVSFVAVAVLAGVCLAVYFPIRTHFAANPGGTVQTHWSDQMRVVLHPRTLLIKTDDVYGVRSLRPFTIFPFVLLVWTVVRAWRRLPDVIKRHAQIAAVINIPLFLLFCVPGEFRDLSLLYIAWLLVIAVNLRDWMGKTMQAMVEQPEMVASD
jgi:hypothetical protein